MYNQINIKKALSKAKSSQYFVSQQSAYSNNIDLDDQIEQLTYKILSLKKSEKAVLNQIIFFSNKHTEAHPAQSTLAERAGCSVRTVYRALVALHETGILQNDRRGTWMTNRYILHPLFNNWHFRNGLRKQLSHIGWCDIPLDHYKDTYIQSLKSTPKKTCLSEYVRPLINSNLLKERRENIYNHQLLVVRESNSNNQEFKEGNPPIVKKQEICKKIIGNSVKAIQKIKGMNEAAVLRLSNYPDVIVEYACRRLLIKKPSGDAYKYFAKICEYRAQELKVKVDIIDGSSHPAAINPRFSLQEDSFADLLTHKTSTSKEPVEILPENTYGTKEFQLKQLETTIKRYKYLLEVNPANKSLENKLRAVEKQYSLLITAEPINKASVIDIAQQGAVFMNKEHLDKLTKLWEEPTATTYRDRCLANLIDGQFSNDGTPEAIVAQYLIDKQRQRLNIPTPQYNPFEDIQECPYTTKDETTWEIVN